MHGLRSAGARPLERPQVREARRQKPVASALGGRLERRRLEDLGAGVAHSARRDGEAAAAADRGAPVRGPARAGRTFHNPFPVRRPRPGPARAAPPEQRGLREAHGAAQMAPAAPGRPSELGRREP
mmetsp:Transcript_94169/g.290377  ORF Transcript_94169/g.290377 Transcript_94169/m.290377 type:complete len:126 (+) Transcript_94169:709-1086(+)